MGKHQDLTGRRFGRLTVLDKNELRKGKYRYWLCKCECGNNKWIYAASLLSGTGTSCGCYRSEVMSSRMSKPDGIKKEKLYRIYLGILTRCYNPKSNNFHLWGGKGIKMCDEWNNDYQAFREWALANGYKEGLSIDRRKADKDYEPSNCRWITQAENSSNGKMNMIRVRLVRKLYENKIFDKSRLAEIYGIGAESMCNILNKRTWASI